VSKAKLSKEECLAKFVHVNTMLSAAFRELERELPGPVLVSTPHGLAPRYQSPLLEHALLMKLARLISVLWSMRLLVETGQVHEQGILQRVADEAGEDIIFLALGKQNGQLAIHRRYLTHFWREEFETGADPQTYKIRHMVKRSEIQDYISKNSPPPATIPSGVSRMVYGVFSGFVHGASTHIFDLVDLRTGLYRLNGLTEISDRLGYLRNALNYPLRGLMAGVVVARSLGHAAAADLLLKEVTRLEEWMDEHAND
jgi:hypothetical protein